MKHRYHGHAQGLVTDGLYGPILIQPSSSEPKPFGLITNSSSDLAAIEKAAGDPQVVMLSDWTKFTSAEYLAVEKAANLDVFCVDSILMNGKGSVNCQPQSLLNELTNPNLAMLLKATNQSVSDKGCTPMNAGAATEGDFNNTNPSAIPAGMWSGCVPTNGSMDLIQVDASSEWANLHFISAASEKALTVSIDQHPMWIYAVDGSYIIPQRADSFIMYNGERYSAMVKLDQTPGDYTMRFANGLPDQVIAGFGTFSYNHGTKTNASTPYINYGGVTVATDAGPLDQTALIPFNVPPPSQTSDQTVFLNLGRFGANWQWTATNKSSYPVEGTDDDPLLFDPNSPTANNGSLVVKTNNNTWVDVVMQVGLAPSNPAQPPHPMHKHSNKAYIIGNGMGMFNYSSVAEAYAAQPQSFNMTTAQYRDSFTTPAILPMPAWVVFRYHSANPGAWYLHCHIQTHLSGGMAISILDGVDVFPQVPAEYLSGDGSYNYQ